jgi:hypothetical protein
MRALSDAHAPEVPRFVQSPVELSHRFLLRARRDVTDGVSFLRPACSIDSETSVSMIERLAPVCRAEVVHWSGKPSRQKTSASCCHGFVCSRLRGRQPTWIKEATATSDPKGFAFAAQCRRQAIQRLRTERPDADKTGSVGGSREREPVAGNGRRGTTTMNDA